MAMAIAFVMGVAVKALVDSLVNDIVMPLVNPLIPGGSWKTAMLVLGPFQFGIGHFVAELINFTIISFVIFLMAKSVLGEEKVSKK